ncbi:MULTISPECIES: molybdenum cofactor biosynthesis protein MoaE [unclassified Methanoculleus]|uniref:molybdenum cofactor biosynthesis protein MoaE n=1 Tax=unclassified Methanoculleus TaxID=2619537 RepID=UPI0025E83ACE|nr:MULTISPECIES: molybdenum cofactor biosynthesis protein MoaE [unclassified Methanoculleus]MCK9318290.1 molybdenum cofactor biosynthesis protein MoaE [Methanoculleus sp.]MDD2253602.1 molybdenum cofactor biosynthesis protein MoaE [Methanoculleus sp.]MDD2788679.1 molybdenum cofactor biosynthesis protein MoaE [Methanoculleus sp.]MDD3216536.1 molybdenum cofactor biosynthesis protein MoaE [Methanoculleus sp.]MDD4314536.1 molybdenum cofactor biosynthesis protein MoaE [Methanoculleus sp.]
MISVTRDDFDVNAVIDRVRRPGMGALVTFLGVVRDDGIDVMELEAYEEVAVKEMETIRDEAFEQYPIEAVEIIHRVGRLRVGEKILLIVVGAGHRKEAFSACEYIIDRIKQSVPIWKKEIGKDGERWVPGESSGGDA